MTVPRWSILAAVLARRWSARTRMSAGAFSPMGFIATFLFVHRIAKLPAETDGPTCLPNEAGIGATAVLAIAHELELFT